MENSSRPTVSGSASNSGGCELGPCFIAALALRHSKSCSMRCGAALASDSADGAAAAPGVAYNIAEVSAAVNGMLTSFESAFPGGLADIVQQLTPPLSIPSTLPGLAVGTGEQMYDWYQNH
jgi:hypothetical protein